MFFKRAVEGTEPKGTVVLANLFIGCADLSIICVKSFCSNVGVFVILSLIHYDYKLKDYVTFN